MLMGSSPTLPLSHATADFIQFPDDGAISLHQLPPQVRSTHARQSHDVQGPQHLH